MTFKTSISLQNNTPEDVICVVPKGQIFENKKIGIGTQNVASAREYKLIIPGNSKISVDIDVLCINQHLSSPNGQKGNVTIFKIDKDFEDQNDLWRILNSPTI